MNPPPPKSATALFWLDVVFVEQLIARNILPKSPEGVYLFEIKSLFDYHSILFGHNFL